MQTEEINAYIESIELKLPKGKCATCGKKAEIYSNGECGDCVRRCATFMHLPVCTKNPCICYPNITKNAPRI